MKRLLLLAFPGCLSGAPVVIENGRGVDRERLEVVESAAIEKPAVIPAGELRVSGREHGLAARRVITGRLRVKLSSRADWAAVGSEFQLEDAGSPAYAPEFRVFRCRPEQALDVLRRLRKDGRVVEADLVLGKSRVRTAAPNDQFYSIQWHLKNTGQNGGVAGFDANVEPIWGTFGGPGTRGSGVRIAIIDDGLESDHPDLEVDATAALNLGSGPPGDANPIVLVDNHGTAVAGVAAARANNGIGGAGVAPEAVVVGERLLGDGFPANPDDWEEAEAFAWLVNAGAATLHVKNNSWGVPDLVKAVEGPGPLARAALRFGAVYGRGGLGTIVTFSGGNGGSRPLPAEAEDSNFNGYSNSIYSIAVAGITDAGLPAPYSEPGANLLVCAPADAEINDGVHSQIVTTDRTGADGYNTNAGSASGGNYTRFFSGTSAATPIVSGVCALMLETNPELGWRDVQEILLHSARQIQPTDPGWTMNAAGFHFHHDVGAGLVDATAACQLAAGWTNLDHMKHVSVDVVPAAAIPDNDPNGVSVTFTLPATVFRVEHVTLRANISHTARGNLEITLSSPAGTVSRFARVHNDTEDGFAEWTFSTVHCWGESAAGTWTLKVADLAAGDTGTLDDATLTIFGTSPVPDSYETWLRATFGDAAVDNPALRETVWGQAADPDTDGFSNLAEGYFDMDPEQADAPAEWSVRAEGVDFIWRWRPSTIAGLEVVPEWSPDLERWYRSGELVDGTLRTITLRTAGEFREAVLPVGTLTRASLRLTIARGS